jgi:hypothetical protein
VPKTYKIALPLATERELRYQRAERVEFEKRFRHFGLPGMKDIIFERVFPIKPDPTRDNKPYPTGGGDLEAQYTLIYLGLRGGGSLAKHITEEKVNEWIDLSIKEGRPLVGMVATCVNAVMASGVLGFMYEHDAVVEEETEEGEGKAEAPSTSSSAT